MSQLSRTVGLVLNRLLVHTDLDIKPEAREVDLPGPAGTKAHG